ncbi:hypothetical protein L6164_030860 [Bauhinia variegata]|uniref:Uncharacterized protein n=1 Tax=Bauhinia variegata TaxID=167791 RepID=A0ACB9LDN9_BAUVA|nr:hypothetical protein L6164_030860 [Bauhinia variegata]
MVVSASMAIQDQNGVTRSPVGNGVSVSSGLHSASPIQLNDQFSCGNDFAPKARKPYTITKQRERWTDEEHKKFLEALKLYGRAWRRIEEHVGTKTAVQIRSHAQKFFSKVLRESSGSSTSSMESIEIPPPRPKRKPMHPYPRKHVEPSAREVSNLEPPIMSESLKSLNFEQENQSPKSVLSANGSDTLASSDSDTPNGSSSPISSISGVHTSSFGVDQRKMLSEEDGSPPPARVNAGAALDEQAHMKFQLFPEEGVSAKEDAAEKSPGRTVKLFGTTLLVTDTCKPSSPTAEASKSKPLYEAKTVQASHGAMYIMQLQNGILAQSPTPTTAFVPWCKVRPFIPLPQQREESVGKHSESNFGEVEDTEIQKEWSWSGSNTSADNAEKPDIEAKTSSQQRARNCAKGFVPYKRCIAEREGENQSCAEDREEQRIRLSL